MPFCLELERSGPGHYSPRNQLLSYSWSKGKRDESPDVGEQIFTGQPAQQERGSA